MQWRTCFFRKNILLTLNQECGFFFFWFCLQLGIKKFGCLESCYFDLNNFPKLFICFPVTLRIVLMYNVFWLYATQSPYVITGKLNYYFNLCFLNQNGILLIYITNLQLLKALQSVFTAAVLRLNNPNLELQLHKFGEEYFSN